MGGEYLTKFRSAFTRAVFITAFFIVVHPLVWSIWEVDHNCSPQKCVKQCHWLAREFYLWTIPNQNNGCQEMIDTVFDDANCTKHGCTEDGSVRQCTSICSYGIDLRPHVLKLYKPIYPDICQIPLWHANWTHVESLGELVACFSRQNILLKFGFLLLDASIGLSQESQDQYMTWFDERCSLYKGVN